MGIISVVASGVLKGCHVGELAHKYDILAMLLALASLSLANVAIYQKVASHLAVSFVAEAFISILQSLHLCELQFSRYLELRWCLRSFFLRGGHICESHQRLIRIFTRLASLVGWIRMGYAEKLLLTMLVTVTEVARVNGHYKIRGRLHHEVLC